MNGHAHDSKSSMPTSVTGKDQTDFEKVRHGALNDHTCITDSNVMFLYL